MESFKIPLDILEKYAFAEVLKILVYIYRTETNICQVLMPKLLSLYYQYKCFIDFIHLQLLDLLHSPKENEEKIKNLVGGRAGVFSHNEAIEKLVKYRIKMNGTEDEVIKFLIEEWQLKFNFNKPVFLYIYFIL